MILAALLLWAAADVVETTDGRQIEGKVVFQDAVVVKIKTPLGTIELPRASVTKITPGPTREEILADKRRDAKSADDHMALSRWCTANSLSKQAREELEAAIALDPRHDAAHRALGHVRDGDDWVTPDEKKKREKGRERAALEAQGLVEHQGRWVSKEEKEALEKGFVRFGGRWVPEEEAKRASGLERFGGKWIPADEIPFRERGAAAGKLLGVSVWNGELTRHFSVFGAYEPEFVKTVADGGERAHDFLDRLFGGDGSGATIDAGNPRAPWMKESEGPKIAPPGGRFAPKGESAPASAAAVTATAPVRTEVFLVDGEAEYDKAVDRSYAESKRWLWDGWAPQAKKTFGFFVFAPLGVSVTVRRDRDRGAVPGHTFHQIGHVLANRHLHGASLLPIWYDESLAALTEVAAAGQPSVFCVLPSTGTSAGDGRRASAPRAWREELKTAVAAGRPLSLTAIVQRDLNDLDVADIEKGMSVLEYLAARDPKAVERFHRRIRKLWGLERLPAAARAYHDDAFKEAVKTDVAGVDAEWRKWFLGR